MEKWIATVTQLRVIMMLITGAADGGAVCWCQVC